MKRDFTAWWFLDQPLSDDVTNELNISPSTFHGVTADSGSESPYYRDFTITFTHTQTFSVGPLCTCDQPETETAT